MLGLMRKRTHEWEIATINAGHYDNVVALETRYQDFVDAEYNRVFRLCRAQLHDWARDGFYELFSSGSLTMPRLRAMFAEAENMLSPEKLRLKEEEIIG